MMVDSEESVRPFGFSSKFWAASWWKSSGTLLVGFAFGLGLMALIWLFGPP
jgi:hypothetical protein